MTGPPRQRSDTGSVQLLLDLVSNTLDPGYAAAAARHGDDRPSHWWERAAVALGCLLIGLLLVVAYVHTHRGAPEAARVHTRLVDRVRAAQSEANGLAQQVTSAQASLSRQQDRVLPAAGSLARSLAAAQQAIGEVAVTGPGLTVTLSEPPAPTLSASAGRGDTTALGTTNILTDRDVRSVVNQLWSDGAEAIAVNGIRLSSTTAIRFAGEAVLVDFQPITSPYEIEAIGNADNLSTDFAQSAVASRYQTLVSADAIGFSFGNSGHLKLPAVTPVLPHYASALPSPSRTAR